MAHVYNNNINVYEYVMIKLVYILTIRCVLYCVTGAVDRQGNAVILWVEGQSGHSSETMSDVNAAELILYYASLRNR